MPFKCTKCCKLFSCQSNLDAHVNKKKPCFLEKVNENCINCDFCNNSFSTQSNLNRHIKRCIAKKNPELLLKQIENMKKLLQKKDDIIQELRNDSHSNKIESEDSNNSYEHFESSKNIKNDNYIYIIKVREFIKTNENIYKVGRTDKGFSKRVKSYPKGSVVMCIVKVPNSKKYETALKKSFNLLFKRRKDIGHEYYEANYQDMYKNMHKVIRNLNKEYNQIVS